MKAFGDHIETIGVAEIARNLAKNITGVQEKAGKLREKTRDMYNTMEEVLEDIACVR